MKRAWFSLLIVLALTALLAVPAMAAETQATVYGNSEVTTLEEAIAQASGTNYVTLQADVAEDVTVDKDLYLDLNGYNITGTVTIAEGKILYLFDSKTSDYNVDDGDYGRIVGEVTGSGTIARTMNTPSTYGHNYRYLTIKDGVGYHAHRIYISVKSTVLYPARPAVNYRTVLRCDSIVAKYLNTETGAYGVRVKAYDTVNGEYRLNSSGEDTIYAAYEQDVEKWDGTNDNNRITQLNNILYTSLTLEQQKERAENTRWEVCAYIRVDDQFGSDNEVVSATSKRTVKQVVQAANAEEPATLSMNQKAALGNMYTTYQDMMGGWGLNNILLYTGDYVRSCLCGDPESTENPCAIAGHKVVTWQRWTDNLSFPAETGNYILQSPLALTEQPSVSGFVCINLNGYDWFGYVPQVQDGAVLNLVNWSGTASTIEGSNALQIASGGNVSLYDNIALKNADDFTPSLGMIENKGDMNMYGGTVVSSGRAIYLESGSYMFVNKGTITGGDVGTSNGGAVVNCGILEIEGSALIQGGSAKLGGSIYTATTGGKLYISGGTVSAGSAEKGGSIYVAGGEATISGGTVTGGYASDTGGNIYIASNGQLTVSGGSVLDGCGANNGGNIRMDSGKLNVSGGTISGGYKGSKDSPNYSTNMANVYAYGGDVTLSGGTVNGIRVLANGETTLTLSGDATVGTNPAGHGLTLNVCADIVSTGEQAFTGSVALSNVATTGGKLTNATDAKYVANFSCGTVSTVDMAAYYQDGCIYVGQTKTMCVCGGQAENVGDHKCSSVSFTALTGATQLPAEGNYFLSADLTLTKQTYYATASKSLNLDLNGHSITFKAANDYDRVFQVQDTATDVTIGLTDSVGGGSVKIDASAVANTNYGAMVWLRLAGQTFNLYNGVLDASNLTSSNGGVAVRLNAGTFNMYGGQIKGGLDSNTNASSVNLGGTATIQSGAEFNLYKGTVSGGRASVNGGNFMVRGVLNIAGGTVSGGYAANQGGNIYIADGGEVTVSAGAVSDGYCGGVGGNVMTVKGSKLTVSGGTLSGGYKWDGTTKNYNTAFANVYSYGGDVTLSDGTVSGLAFYKGDADAPVLTLSGNAVINANPANKGLTLSGATATIDESQGDFAGSIAVSTTGQITGTASKDYTGNFSSLADGYLPVLQNGCIYNQQGKYMCVCGGKAVSVGDHQCEDVLFTPWSEGDSLPTTTGNYYLTKAVTLSGSAAFTTAAEVNIDLAGYSITCASTNGDDRIFKIQGGTAGYKVTVGLTDSVGGGSVVRSHAGADNIKYGSIVWLADTNHTFNLYAGILDGSAVSSSNGGAVIKVSNGKFNMYGGEVKGGKDNNTNTSSSVRGGGAVTIESAGTFNLYKGTVSGGESVSNGGSFMVKGILSVKGGTITGGYAANQGGNLYIADGGKVSVSAGAVSNGYVGSVGGNVMTVKGSTLTVSGGTLSGGYKWDGTTKNYNTAFANVYSYGGDVTLSGGTVSGLAFYKGDAETPQLIISGDAVINANPANKGLTLNSTTVTIDDSKSIFTGSIAMSSTGYITGVNSRDYSANFSSLVANTNVFHYESKIYIGEEGKLMCACGGKSVSVGDHQCEEVLWRAWTEEDSLPNSTGNYYLTKPVTLSGSAAFTTAAEVNIDLAGYSITCASTNGDDRIFKIQGGTSGYEVTVGLTDSVGGGSVVRSHTGADNIKYGSIVWLADTNHTFNLYAGVLDGSSVSSSNGGAVVKVSNGKFNMYGGEVKGGYDNNTNTSSSVRGGGAVTIESAGTFNLYGGTVSGGGSVSTGGNFMVKGTLNIKGGEVLNGYVSDRGGNIHVAAGGKLDISGGQINGGHKGTAESPNYATALANVFSYGSVTVSGGTMSGLSVYSGGALTLSGSPVINGSRGLYLDGVTAIIDDSEIAFTGEVDVWSTGYITGENSTDYSAQFTALQVGYSVLYSENKLYVAQGDKMMCVCGGKTRNVGDHVCKSVAWKAWEHTDSLPTETGNWYLTDHVILSGSVQYKAAATVNIDLAGFDVTCASTNGDDRIFKIQGGSSGYKVTVGLTDSVGGSEVKRTHEGADTVKYGSVVWLADTNHTFNLYAGVLDGEGVVSSNGGAVVKLSAGTFNMYGGEMKGGKDDNSNTSSSIRGGGVAAIESGAAFNLYAGNVSGGDSVSAGGNFVVRGNLHIKGGTVSGGSSTQEGGNIYVATSGELTVSGGTVTEGYAGTNGGNVSVDGTVTVSAGAVSNGYVGNVGGNIMVNRDAALTVSGGAVSGGYKWDGASKSYTDKFANVYSYGGDVALSGGTVSGLAFYKADDQTEAPTLTLSGNAVINSYTDSTTGQKSVGLYLSSNESYAAYATVSEDFSGAVALSVAGKVTNATTADKQQRFTSLVEGQQPAFDDTDSCIYNLGDFRVGYASVNITPTEDVGLWGYGGDAESRVYKAGESEVKGDLYMTCVAMTDEENNTVLMYTADLGCAERSTTHEIRTAVSAATGVSYYNIMFTATHTHSAPYTTAEDAPAYNAKLQTAAVSAAEAALADRAKADMYFGTGSTANLNFVRHYINTSGEYVSDNHGDRDNVKSHVSDADEEMRIVKFTRNGKTPVVLVNWQCHPHMTGGYDETAVSADIVGAFRDSMGSDYLVAYYQGGAGNINPTSRISGEEANTDRNYLVHGQLMAQVAKNVLSGTMTQVTTGKITVVNKTYSAAIYNDAEKLTNAQKVVKSYESLAGTVLSSYKASYAESVGRNLDPVVYSIHHAWAIQLRQQLLESASTVNLEINAITIGDDFAWSTMPGEFFDTTAQNIRDNDGYEYSFVAAYTNGYTGYFPTEAAWGYGSYEVDVTRVVEGTAETVATELLAMLKKGE